MFGEKDEKRTKGIEKYKTINERFSD